MYSLLIACCALITFCSAATRPEIPGTFEALTTVEVHRGRAAEFGKGYYCSDESKKMQVRNDTLIDGPNKGDYFYQFQDYPVHKEFHIRPDGGREECSDEPTRGEYEPPFAWVKNAKYNGSEEVEHRTLDVWYVKLGSTEIAVGVDTDTPNVPVVLMQKGVGEERIATFTKFTAQTPSATYFNIPRQCDEGRH